jgi:hypothetical protein
MYLHHHTLFTRVPVAHLGYSVTRPSNLKEDFSLYVRLRGRRHHELCLLHVSCRTPGKIRLVLFTLRVGKVRAFIGVKCQAETTFQRTQMVSKNVRVLDDVSIPSICQWYVVFAYGNVPWQGQSSLMQAFVGVLAYPHCFLKLQQHHRLQIWSQHDSMQASQENRLNRLVLVYLIILWRTSAEYRTQFHWHLPIISYVREKRPKTRSSLSSQTLVCVRSGGARGLEDLRSEAHPKFPASGLYTTSITVRFSVFIGLLLSAIALASVICLP